MNKKLPATFFAVLAVIILVVASQSFFIVDQTEIAIVTQLGKPLPGVRKPGLHLKLPVIQNAIFFDARLLDYDAKPADILTEDKKTMRVDNYAKWRIANPLQFYRAVHSIPEAGARLDDVIYSQIRQALGNYTLIQIVHHKRAEIMAVVTKNSNQELESYGIEVVDVRIKATDLPVQNRDAIFNRMRAERERMAKQYRSEGKEAAAKIRAGADKEKTLILAEATRQSDVLRGEGDAEAVKIYAKAFTTAPEFYEFKRTMDAYANSLQHKSRMILTPDNEFLKYLK